MESISFPEQLRQGFQEALASARLPTLRGSHPTLSGLAADRLVRMARDRTLSPRVRDRILLAVLHRYRSGSREKWAPIVLEILAPQMLDLLVTFEPSDLISGEDVAQQLVMATLGAALTVPLGRNARWVEQRVLLRAGQGVARWLGRESRRRSRRADLDSPSVDRQAVEVWRITELVSTYPERHRRGRR